MAISQYYDSGQTPLSLDETGGLIPDHVTTQKELNEWEAENILGAREWVYSKKHKDILNIEFANLLHKKMFYHTWSWAGKFRNSNKNIGVETLQIAAELIKIVQTSKVV